MRSIGKSIPLLLAQITQKFIILLISSRLSNSIGLTAYGNFAYARSYINFIDTTISSSLFPILIKEIQQLKNKRAQLKTFISRLTAIYIIVAFISFYILFNRSQYTTTQSALLIALSILILIYGLLQAITSAYKKYYLILKGTTISAFVAIALCFFFGFYLSFEWAILSLCIFYICEITTRAYGITKSAKEKLTPKETQETTSTPNKPSKTKKTSLIYSLLASITNALLFLYYRDYSANLDNGLTTLGNIDIGFQLVAVSFMALNALSLIQYSTLNSVYNKQPKKELTKALTTQFAISATLFTATLTLGKFYYQIFFKTADIGYLYTLAAAIPVYSIALTLNRYIVLMQKEIYLLYGSIFGGIIGFTTLQSQILHGFALGYFFAIYYTGTAIVYSIVTLKKATS